MGRRQILVGLAVAVGVVVLSAGGSYLGIHLPDWMSDERERLELDLSRVSAELQDALIRLDEVREDRDAQREAVASLTRDLTESERQVGTLQSALALSGPLTDQYTALTRELANLTAEYSALQQSYDEIQGQTGPLVRIRTPELQGDALLLDTSVPGVTYTGAVCSGSMEPNISCDDLLILYTPAITDLDVGDIIYFRRQNAECTGPMDGRFMLHRIIEVTAGTEGIAFRTKGDALAVPDACPVPASDVLYKLLTSIREARITPEQ